MKYFSLAQIKEALQLLQPHHAIFATTFFVMKKAGISIGTKARFSLDAANKEFLEKHYRVHPKSAYFFRVMRQGTARKDWNNPDYAGKGLQRVNTSISPNPFLHDRNDNTWGWSPQYVDLLAKQLPRGVKIPLYHVAVWFYRNREWPDSITRQKILKTFITEYSLTQRETSVLFQTEIISQLTEAESFQDTPVKWHQILSGCTLPNDVPPETSGILSFLETEGIGPVKQLRFEPAKRLNIITGDNGLGKTFLLDLSWWALTQDWADRPALPIPLNKDSSIKFVVSGGIDDQSVKARFSPQTCNWVLLSRLPSISGLVIYARVDGSFAVWDPVNTILSGSDHGGSWPGMKFTREQLWDGKPGQIEGLLRDWVRWQERPDRYSAFEKFKAVLDRVSPPDLGKLEIGDPVRLPGDPRPIPTLIHPYDTVPILFESAGIKRIVTLAYLIVWAWEEHKIQAKGSGKREERQMVVLVDEAEAHLHPKWQRVILPALLEIAGILSSELSLQLIVATHSPLVLASSEPVFNANEDKLFHLDIATSGKVSFKEIPFEVRGSIDSWLASPVFQLKHPGSPEREEAIKEALRLQESKSITTEQVELITQKLRDYLAPEDPFWVRWVFFAEQHGVNL